MFIPEEFYFANIKPLKEKWRGAQKIAKGIENAWIINVLLERNCYLKKKNGITKAIKLIIADNLAQLKNK